MVFETYEIADIGTAYLEPRDLGLLATAPYHLSEIDEGYGSILWVPKPKEIDEYVREAKAHGMSDRFVQIIRELAKQSIPYVRFDVDGGDVDGLEPITGERCTRNCWN